MVECLESLPLDLLCDLAIRWSVYCSRSPSTDLLEEPGLTPRTVVDLSDEQLLELDLRTDSKRNGSTESTHFGSFCS